MGRLKRKPAEGAASGAPTTDRVAEALRPLEEAMAAALPARPKSLSAWAWRDWLKSIAEFIGTVLVAKVEELLGPGGGAEKKARVLEAIERIYLDAGINIPWVPQALELLALRQIASWVIDKIVAQLNDSGLLPKAA